MASSLCIPLISVCYLGECIEAETMSCKCLVC